MILQLRGTLMFLIPLDSRQPVKPGNWRCKARRFERISLLFISCVVFSFLNCINIKRPPGSTNSGPILPPPLTCLSALSVVVNCSNELEVVGFLFKARFVFMYLL